MLARRYNIVNRCLALAETPTGGSRVSDHWEFFPCQMGAQLAFVFYDHGIRETIDSFEENQQVRFDLTYKSPNDNGLPTDEEFEAVNGVEDRIEEFVTSSGGIYVGRVTTAGHRYFYSFAGVSAEQLDGFVDGVSASTGYALEVRIVEDPEKKGYWSDLYPTADDWQMIQDAKVVEALKNSGDLDQIKRRIDHWVYFKSKSNAKTFIAWVEEHGFSLESMTRTEPLRGDWKVQFHRLDSPELYTINGITYNLRHKAIELDGEYDGWETSVVKVMP